MAEIDAIVSSRALKEENISSYNSGNIRKINCINDGKDVLI
jgi:hypothetical protein